MIVKCLDGVKWVIIGDNVIVDPRYVSQYRSSVRRRIPHLSRAVVIYVLAYAAMFLGVVAHGFYIGSL